MEVGEADLLAIKAANLSFVSAPAASRAPSFREYSSRPTAHAGAAILRTFGSSVGTFAIVLLPDGKISCDGSLGFEERDASQPPDPVELNALTLEMQLIVSCSNVKPSPARVHSILSRLPPVTVNLLRVPGVSFTLLEFAARNGQLQVVEVLLSLGADVSVQTPCLWAAYTGNIDIIEVLMQHGAVPAHERGFDGVSCSPSPAASVARSVACEAYKSPVFSYA